MIEPMLKKVRTKALFFSFLKQSSLLAGSSPVKYRVSVLRGLSYISLKNPVEFIGLMASKGTF